MHKSGGLIVYCISHILHNSQFQPCPAPATCSASVSSSAGAGAASLAPGTAPPRAGCPRSGGRGSGSVMDTTRVWHRYTVLPGLWPWAWQYLQGQNIHTNGKCFYKCGDKPLQMVTLLWNNSIQLLLFLLFLIKVTCISGDWDQDVEADLTRFGCPVRWVSNSTDEQSQSSMTWSE